MRISNEEMMAPTDIPFDKVPPYRVKVVEYTTPTTRPERKALIKNITGQHLTFLLNIFMSICAPTLAHAQ